MEGECIDPLKSGKWEGGRIHVLQGRFAYQPMERASSRMLGPHTSTDQVASHSSNLINIQGGLMLRPAAFRVPVNKVMATMWGFSAWRVGYRHVGQIILRLSGRCDDTCFSATP